jgi:chaperonin GroES
MNINPLADNVLLELVEQADKTPGGVYLPENAKEKPQTATVVAVGKGARNDKGELIPMSVAVGDTVIFQRYSGIEIKPNGKKYTIVKEREILATLAPEKKLK